MLEPAKSVVKHPRTLAGGISSSLDVVYTAWGGLIDLAGAQLGDHGFYANQSSEIRDVTKANYTQDL